jgi:hypothetical protein
MTATTRRSRSIVPGRRQRHHSFDESVDEPAKVIEGEPTEIESGIPAEENEPLERVEKNDSLDTPACEEE